MNNLDKQRTSSTMIHSSKKFILAISIVCFQATASEPQPVAIIGGFDGNAAYTAFVNSNTNAAGPNLANLPTTAGSAIQAVAINSLGQAIIAGRVGDNATGTPYAAFVNQSTNAANAPISNLLIISGTGRLLSTAINDFNQALIGGNAPIPGPNTLYAAFVNINTNAAGPVVTGLAPPSGNAHINGVDINNSNQALAAGSQTNTPYATYINPITNAAAAMPISNLPGPGDQLYDGAINQSGLALVGGRDNSNNISYAAFIQPNTNTASAPIAPLPIGGVIFGVALNDSDQGIIGGNNGLSAAYAAFVDPITNIASPISNLPNGLNSVINGVAINNFGQALIGGSDGMKAYAAFVDPLTKAASIPITNLPITNGSIIFGVALTMAPLIPTAGLKGNNLIFANYINQNAPQDAFYFFPAFLNGDLPDALESAAPTRNALSLFAADDNLFFLNHGLSLHLRNNRHFKHRIPRPLRNDQEVAVFIKTNPYLLQSTDAAFFPEEEESTKEFAAEESGDAPIELETNTEETVFSSEKCSPSEKNRPYTLWFEGLGAFASQKAQRQTIGFDPSMGGFILGFDGNANPKSQVGGGIAYTFTHIHEHRDAGYSHINQEYLFAYATWANDQFYFDGALWGGCFQIHQVRKIDVSGFHFQSTSNPIGWQLSPHVEFGYDYNILTYCKKEIHCTINPFVMLDWANAWQQAFQEKGISPFNTRQTAHYSSFLRTELSVRFYEMIAFDTWRLALEEKMGYVNKTPFGVGIVNGFLVGSPGSFTLETLSSSQNLGVAEMSFIFEPINPAYPYGTLSYQGEFNGVYQSHQAILEISWDF